MNNWGANHGAISYGHIGADLITMCSMLRIPVCMHNVPQEKIFRPAAWNAFGMDKEGQDYRACQAYGPLYRWPGHLPIITASPAPTLENQLLLFSFKSAVSIRPFPPV